MPQNSVLSIAQTPDGYLWIGTYEGLARFDGVDFTVFNNVNTPAIKSNFVGALLADRGGNLWIGTNGGGLVRRSGNDFVRYSIADGLLSDFISCLFEDADGRIWVGSAKGGLNVFRDGKLTKLTVADGLPNDSVMSLAEDEAGGLWVGTRDGLALWKDNKFTNYHIGDALGRNTVLTLRLTRADGLLIGTMNGVKRWLNGRMTTFAVNGEVDHALVQVIITDGHGDLWIGTQGKGLYRRKQGETIFEKLSGPSPDEYFYSIYTGGDKAVWVGTIYGGLLKFQRQRFRSFTAADEFPENGMRTIYESRSGDLWLGGAASLRRLRNGVMSSYSPEQIIQYGVLAIAEDAGGRIWVGGGRGVSKFTGSKFVPLTAEGELSEKTVFALLGDRAGNLWIGTREDGLKKFRDGHLTNYQTAQGLAGNFVVSLFEDRGGAIWIGTTEGLSRLRDERITSWKLGDGTAVHNVINAFYEDENGALWIGTSGGGLYRFKDEKFVNVASRDGLYDNLTYTLLESGGDLWMSGNKGIYRASLPELNDFADGHRADVNSYNYGTEDGMLNRECNGKGWKARDGRLWFVTVKGAVRVEPRAENSPPPSVLIERVGLDGEARSDVAPLEIEPGNDNLEIKYAAISWPRPRQIKFKYRMNNLDADWTEAGNRRTAYYPYLPPGQYQFQVIADNGDGVWNERGATLEIVVLPPFYRTWWFLAAAGFIAAGILSIGYQYRVGQMRREQLAQQAFSQQLIASQETERKRIASELHDSLGQHLLIIKNRAALGIDFAPTGGPAKEQLEEINASAAQAISEVRAIAYNLRPLNLDRLGLTVVLEEMIEKVADTSGIDFSREITPLHGLFSPEGEISFYRVVQESLSNVVRHSRAASAGVKIWREDGHLLALVSDDGCGINQSTDTNSGVLARRGLGLTSIAERVRLLGGTHTIDSAPGQGTTLSIKIPLPQANGGNANVGRDNRADR